MENVLTFKNRLDASKYLLKSLIWSNTWILPTGSTPQTLYALMRCSSILKENAHMITTFNLDEYVDSHEYRDFMKTELFDHVKFKNNHIFDGKANDIEKEISRYQQLLDNTEIDVAVVGIGKNGHIAFNEPGSDINSKCRQVKLHTNTIETNKTAHTHAITMGIGDIMRAKKVFIIAFGQSKQDIIYNLFKSGFDEQYPMSNIMKNHPNWTLLVDNSTGYKIKKQMELHINTTNFNFIQNKKLLIFSPHPDDDVIGMGAMLHKLSQNNVVYIIYQTDGSGGGDAHIRKNEARNALNVLNPNIIMRVDSLPFYSTQTRTITKLDIEETVKQIELFEPNYIFSCIDWNDPKDTHWKCFHIVKEAVNQTHTNMKFYGYYSAWSKIDWTYNPNNLIYEFDEEMMKLKIASVKAHVSQLKPVNGDETTPFWLRVKNMTEKHKYAKQTKKYLEIIRKM